MPLAAGRPERLAAAAFCFFLVVVLGWAVQHGLTAAWDEAGMRALSAGPAPAAWRAVSRLGDSVVRLPIAAAAAVFLLWRHRRAAAADLLLIVAGGAVLNGLAKQIATRPRPGLLQHLEAVEGFSFPSGHSAGIVAVALGLALTLAPPKRRGAALLLATGVIVAVGLSRVALAVHWPSDVLAGWIEGLGWVMLVRAMIRTRA